uniref:Ig-like domain-containing protein n=1 Tax=Strongyloides stercoralis TaxID=6248 RepID=A0A0K0ERS0_STRER
MIHLPHNSLIFFLCFIYFYVTFLHVTSTAINLGTFRVEQHSYGIESYNKEKQPKESEEKFGFSSTEPTKIDATDVNSRSNLSNTVVKKSNTDNSIHQKDNSSYNEGNNTINETINNTVTTSNEGYSSTTQPSTMKTKLVTEESITSTTKIVSTTTISTTTTTTTTTTTATTTTTTAIPTTSTDDTNSAILSETDDKKNDEQPTFNLIEESTNFGKLNSDGSDFDYQSLPKGVWKIRNVKKFSFTCPSGSVTSKFQDYYEVIEVMKKNEINNWVSIKKIENQKIGENDLIFKMGISNETLQDLNFKFLTFIGDFQCKYSYKKDSGGEYELIKRTPNLKIRFGAVTFLVEANVKLKDNIKLSCPMLEHVKMYRQSSMYFDDNSSNYVDGDYKRVVFTALPKNSIRAENDTSIIIKNLKSQNLGFYHCVYTDGTPNDTELRLVFKLFSSEFDNLKIDNLYLKAIFVYMLLTLAILFISLIYL